jgi:hypothetical protein
VGTADRAGGSSPHVAIIEVLHAPRPQPLYKYTHRKHAEALAHRGEIRLGTLYDYQDVELHGPMIGDEDEGKKVLFDNPGIATGATLAAQSPFAARVAARSIGPIAQAPGVGFVGCLFTETHRTSDCWLYCMSAVLSGRVMRGMKKGYDACVRIDYYHAFCSVIGAELVRQNLIADHNWSTGIIWCEYRERWQHYQKDDGLAPIMLKAPKYAEQEEVRFAYFPTRPIAEKHRVLTLPDLADCCTLLDEIPD